MNVVWLRASVAGDKALVKRRKDYGLIGLATGQFAALPADFPQVASLITEKTSRNAA